MDFAAALLRHTLENLFVDLEFEAGERSLHNGSGSRLKPDVLREWK